MRRALGPWIKAIGLLLAIVVATLPSGKTTVLAGEMHAGHSHASHHVHESGDMPVAHCPKSGSGKKCEMQCGITQIEPSALAFAGEPQRRDLRGTPFFLPLARLAGPGIGPPDRPPQS